MSTLEQYLSDPKNLQRAITIGIGIFLIIILATGGTYIIPPGHRGILVTMGKVSPVFAPEGFGMKTPIVTDVIPMSIRQQTKTTQADCYSSDLQQISVELRILYRIPENMIVKIFQQYSGDPFDSLISPRVSEALKEVTALQSAEQFRNLGDGLQNLGSNPIGGPIVRHVLMIVSYDTIESHRYI